MITEGKMQYLYDDKGRRYLDVSLIPALAAAQSASTDCMLKHLPTPLLSCREWF